MKMHAGTSCPKSTSNEVHRTIGQALKKNLSGPVSRVLFFWVNFPKEAIISLRRQLPAVSSSPPEKKLKRIASGRCLERTLFCSALLPMGFTEPDQSPGLLVSSYLTVSPLPPKFPWRRFAFCCTFPDLAAGGRYPPSCPLEPGLSSANRQTASREGAAWPRRRPPGPLRLAHRHDNLTDRRALQEAVACTHEADFWKASQTGDTVSSRQGTPFLHAPQQAASRPQAGSARKRSVAP